MDEAEHFRHAAIVFGALYASEGWYALWEHGRILKSGLRPLYCKARAIVVFDRALAMYDPHQPEGWQDE